MSSTVRDLLARALAEQPQESTIDLDALEGRAKRRVRRRWSAAAAGAAAAVSLAVALPVLATSPPPPQPPAEAGLPELDPDKEYTREYDWDDKKQNTQTEQYSAALWGWFQSEHPGTEYVLDDYMDESDAYMDDKGDHPVPDKFPPLVSTRFGVSVDGERDIYAPFSQDPPDFDIPVYWLRSTAPPYEGEKSDGPLIQLPDAPVADELQVSVFPPGGYTSGTDAPRLDTFTGGSHAFDLLSCQDYVSPGDGETTTDQNGEVECASTRDEHGRSVVQAVTTLTSEGETAADRIEHAVVLYRDDGSAIVVRDIVSGVGEEDYEGTPPSLSTKELASLAAALPEAEVN